MTIIYPIKADGFNLVDSSSPENEAVLGYLYVEAEAAEIARRVNAYDRLLAALRLISAVYDDGGDHTAFASAQCEEMRDIAVAALREQGEARP